MVLCSIISCDPFDNFNKVLEVLKFELDMIFKVTDL